MRPHTCTQNHCEMEQDLISPFHEHKTLRQYSSLKVHASDTFQGFVLVKVVKLGPVPFHNGFVYDCWLLKHSCQDKDVSFYIIIPSKTARASLYSFPFDHKCHYCMQAKPFFISKMDLEVSIKQST